MGVPHDPHGVKKLKQRIAELEQQLAAKQAKLDALMFEHCPEEMTEQQYLDYEKAIRALKNSAQTVDPIAPSVASESAG